MGLPYWPAVFLFGGEDKLAMGLLCWLSQLITNKEVWGISGYYQPWETNRSFEYHATETDLFYTPHAAKVPRKLSNTGLENSLLSHCLSTKTSDYVRRPGDPQTPEVQNALRA